MGLRLRIALSFSCSWAITLICPRILVSPSKKVVWIADDGSADKNELDV